VYAVERRGAIVWLAIAFFLACLVLLHTLNRLHNFTTDFTICFDHAVKHPLIASYPYFILGTKRYSSENFASNKQSKSKGTENKNTKIAVFTGRGANKNRAIFMILDAKGPLPISDLQKLLNKQSGLEITYYASLNKRIHALEKGGYIAQVHPATPNQKGFKAAQYEVLAKFYLAYFLDSNSHEKILCKLTDAHAVIILAELVNAALETTEK